MAIKNIDAVRIVNEHRGESVVITTMNSGNPLFGLPSLTHPEDLDVPVLGSMGKASSIGLGLALARPERKILILDGDGSLLMNLGSLVTISDRSPENLYHFIFENGVYAVTGGQPIPGEGRINFPQMARGAGYAVAYEFDNTEDFATNIEGILNQKGPVLVCLKVVPEIENTPVNFRQKARRNLRSAKEDLARAFGL